MANFVGTAIAALGAALVIRFIYSFYTHRARFHKLPGPPHSMFWGHLQVLGDFVRNVLPSQAHPHQIPLMLLKKYNMNPRYYYMDVWPVQDPVLTLIDPDLQTQVTVEQNAAKHPNLADFTAALSGPGDIVATDGEHWKKWRSILNPGFAAGHLMTLVPAIVDECLIFSEKLAEHADRSDPFRLEEDATRLTVDVIGKVALDVELGTQRGENEMVTAFRDQVHRLPNGSVKNPFTFYAPWAIYRRWSNLRVMRRYVGKLLDDRFAKNAKVKAIKKRRAVIDLALDSYHSMQVADDSEKGNTTSAPLMDAEFRDQAITQNLIFIFAGHDTTSSTICYAYYLLSKHPECLARIRKEHAEVLGSISNAPDAIRKNAHVLNKLEYTLAVIKEVLRLFTPASTPRQGKPGMFLKDPKTGEPIATEGCMLWVVHYAMHRNEAVWGPDASEFKPERFLPENADKLPKGAWRPFELGNRNCIGQELALIETKVILALTVRSFDFKTAFDRLDELENDGTTWARDKSLRQGVQHVAGEEAYQVLIATAKPREGMPVVVTRAGA